MDASDVKFRNYLHYNELARDDVTVNITKSVEFTSYYPTDLANIYNFPIGDGTGQKIGIIQLGGSYLQSDLDTFFDTLGLAVPNFVPYRLDGSTLTWSNQLPPFNPNDIANGEVALDMQIIGAIVPKATINIYFGPNNKLSFFQTISQAINDNCSVISISWGSAELPQIGSGNLDVFDNLFEEAVSRNITILCAAGDHGSTDNYGSLTTNTPDFPASSPNVIACGGTELHANTVSYSIISEVVWNDGADSNGVIWSTGGGISTYFTKPNYQNTVTYPLNGYRGVPDIAGAASGQVPYKIRLNGVWVGVGGTSAVAPLYSGLIARINQIAGTQAGLNILDVIYSNRDTVCRDIVSGNNTAGLIPGYVAGTNWDPCSGCGVLDGTNLLTAYQQYITTTLPPGTTTTTTTSTTTTTTLPPGTTTLPPDTTTTTTLPPDTTTTTTLLPDTTTTTTLPPDTTTTTTLPPDTTTTTTTIRVIIVNGHIIKPGGNLKNANLSGGNLKNLNMTGVNLTGANLSNTNLTGTNLTNAILTGVKSGKIIGIPSRLPNNWKIVKGYLIGPGANLIKANITGANLSKFNMTGANLSYAVLIRTNLSGANLSKANMNNANLTGANLSNTNLTGTNLTNAVLTGVKSGKIIGMPSRLHNNWKLVKGYLIGPGANLIKATIKSANLSKFNMAGANLSYAVLNGTNLSGANLKKANMTNANITSVNISKTIMAYSILKGIISSKLIGVPSSLPGGWILVNGKIIKK